VVPTSLESDSRRNLSHSADPQRLRFVLDFGGYIDFIVAHMTEPGWLGVVIAALVDPPSGIILPLILLGLGLIYRDSRRSAVRSPRIKTTFHPEAASDVNLTMESNLADLPNRCPQEGQIASMRLFYHPGSGVSEPVGFIIKHCRTGEDVEWFSDLKFPQVYRSEITNYGPRPLLQVGLKFKIEYQETSPGASGETIISGNIVHSGEWWVLLPNIDPGKSNAAYSTSTMKATILLGLLRRPSLHILILTTRSNNRHCYYILVWCLVCLFGQWSEQNDQQWPGLANLL
jgi:hypothetical protein